MALLPSFVPEVAQEAASALARLAKNSDDNQRRLREVGGVRPLVALLGRGLADAR